MKSLHHPLEKDVAKLKKKIQTPYHTEISHASLGIYVHSITRIYAHAFFAVHATYQFVLPLHT